MLSMTPKGKGRKTMNVPATYDSSPIVITPFGLPGGGLEFLSLGISTLLALVFVTYLLGCYFQEFVRRRRVRHRKRLARLKSVPLGADRETVIERCLHRRDSAMASDVAGNLPALDWRGLHALIPSHARVTLVWDTGRANEGHSPRVHTVIEAAEEEIISASSEATFR